MNKVLTLLITMLISLSGWPKTKGRTGVLQLRGQVPVKTSIEFSQGQNGVLIPTIISNAPQRAMNLKVKTARSPASFSGVTEVVIESP